MNKAKEQKEIRERKENEIIIDTKPTLDSDTRQLIHTIGNKLGGDQQTLSMFNKLLAKHYKLQ